MASPLQKQINFLEASGLVNLSSAQPELEYLFRHGLIQDAAYESLLKQDRKRLHQVVGEALEQTYAEQLADIAPILGEHFAHAGDAPRATRYLTLAGETALKRNALPEATTHYTRALDWAQQAGLPIALLHRARARAHDQAGHFDLALADYEAACQAAATTGEHALECEVLLDLGLLWASRDYARTGEYYQQAFERAQTLNLPALFGLTLNRLGNWRMNRGELDDALQLHLQARAIFEELNDQSGLAQTIDLLGMTSLQRNEIPQGLAYYRRAIELFRALNDLGGQSSTLAMLALLESYPVLQANGEVIAPDLPQAIRDGETALALTRTMGWRSGEAYAFYVLGICHEMACNYGQSLAYIHQGFNLAQTIGHHQWFVANACGLGNLYLELGAWAEARRYFEQAWDLARDMGSLIWLFNVAGGLALTCLVQNDLTRAETVLSQLPSDSEARQFFGHNFARQGSAELAIARGDPHTALKILRDIEELFPDFFYWGEHNPARFAVIRAQALWQLGRAAEAEAALVAVQQTAIGEGLQLRLWRAQVLLGKLYLAQGRPTEAEQVWANARTVLDRLAQSVTEAPLREQFLRTAFASVVLP